MGAYRTQGPTGNELFSPLRPPLQRPLIDTGTLVQSCSAPPGVLNTPDSESASEQWRTAEVVKTATSTVAPSAAMLTWDSFVRSHVYEPAARAISQQGEELVRSGAMSPREAAAWVNAQRNALLIHVRDNRNTPLGRSISEMLKPRDQLPDLDTLVERNRARRPGASETELLNAVISSGAKTRRSVNRMAVVIRFSGPVAVGIDIVMSGYLIAEAAPEDRARVAAGQVGGVVGGGVGGWAGAKLGCAGGAAVGVWFKVVGAVPGCAIGAIGGALGLGYAGSQLGNSAGEYLWDAAETHIRWDD